ncbi:MAG TPA: hypothetical protein VHS79_03980 [Actinomycetes bacterium]|nr:hypothetical protein [Actinomycetes bacterium]
MAATDPRGRAAAGEALRWLFRAHPTGRRWANGQTSYWDGTPVTYG